MGKIQDPGSGINIPDPQHWPNHIKFISSSFFELMLTPPISNSDELTQWSLQLIHYSETEPAQLELYTTEFKFRKNDLRFEVSVRRDESLYDRSLERDQKNRFQNWILWHMA